MRKPTDYSEFKATLANDKPGREWQVVLQSLWWDAKGDWRRAHDLVDGSNAKNADAIHAYLHRKEGDEWNAGYWYRRAAKQFPQMSLEQEFRQLVEEQL